MTTISLQPKSLATFPSLASPDLAVDEDYFDPINRPEKWWPAMARPLGYDRVAQARYQKLIDRLTGTSRDGQSLIRLDWGPEVLGWQPYPLGSNPIGYTQPTWLALWDHEGSDVAAPRWVLSERIEPEQYLPGWENDRWLWMDTPNRAVIYDALGNEVTEKGRLHDVKGDPPPNGFYSPLHCHLVHKHGCCQRPGNGERCWGYYAEPNTDLLELVGSWAWVARNDKEVDPLAPVALLPENRAGNNRVEAHLVAQKEDPRSMANEIDLTPRIVKRPVGYQIGG